jgi:hypothetical protein
MNAPVPAPAPQAVTQDTSEQPGALERDLREWASSVPGEFDELPEDERRAVVDSAFGGLYVPSQGAK